MDVRTRNNLGNNELRQPSHQKKVVELMSISFNVGPPSLAIPAGTKHQINVGLTLTNVKATFIGRLLFAGIQAYTDLNQVGWRLIRVSSLEHGRVVATPCVPREDPHVLVSASRPGDGLFMVIPSGRCRPNPMASTRSLPLRKTTGSSWNQAQAQALRVRISTSARGLRAQSHHVPRCVLVAVRWGLPLAVFCLSGIPAGARQKRISPVLVAHSLWCRWRSMLWFDTAKT